MLNPRAIATLGIGFGALAVATIGFIVEPDVTAQRSSSGGGYSRAIKHYQQPIQTIRHDRDIMDIMHMVIASGILEQD